MKKIKSPPPQKKPTAVPRPVRHIVDFETVRHSGGVFVIGSDFAVERDGIVVRPYQEQITLAATLRAMEERNPSVRYCRDGSCLRPHCWTGDGKNVGNRFPAMVNPDPRIHVMRSRQHSRSSLLTMMATILASTPPPSRVLVARPDDGKVAGFPVDAAIVDEIDETAPSLVWDSITGDDPGTRRERRQRFRRMAKTSNFDGRR